MKFDLSGQWSLSSPEMPDVIIPAQLPGDNYSALFNAGIIPDPYYGKNEEIVQKYRKYKWSFKRDFEVSAEMLAKKYIYLEVKNLPDKIECYNFENLEEKEFVLQKLRYVGRTILDSKNYTNEKGQEVKFKSEEDIPDPQEKMIYIIEDSEGQQLFKKIIYLNGSFQLFDDKIKGVLINSFDLAHVSIIYTFLLEKGNYRSVIAEEENG